MINYCFIKNVHKLWINQYFLLYFVKKDKKEMMHTITDFVELDILIARIPCWLRQSNSNEVVFIKIIYT